MHGDAAHGELAITSCSHEMAGAGLDQIALCHQSREQRFQFFPAGSACAHLADELLEIGLGMGQPRDMFEQGGFRHITMVLTLNDLAATNSVCWSSNRREVTAMRVRPMKMLAFLLIPAAVAAGPARIARLGELEGKVEVQLHAADAWRPAVRNLPVVESTWVRTAPAARVEME